ncbi:hypothetical protein HZS55_09160 [Halosimplex rubrum]|uniref:Uncharacterized protein n=1 Tax=Halosimplex rubrum TaxID=869889 RepID=A0A7D5T5B7_9EURY|nr:hypothetical protein [Halosimplex rubrum]QLH77453.1 hypothetical protein HZS55_09160 [Halosimplex rubrum]
MPTRLPQKPAQAFIDQFLLQDWDPAGAVGYDTTASPGAEAFVDLATSVHKTGESFPTLVVQGSTETSGGASTYDFVTTNGPGQMRDGQLLVTARAEDQGGENYTGDSSTYAAVDAEDIVATLIDEVEDVCIRNANGGSSEFNALGSQPVADAPNDYDETPTVLIDQCTVSYSWDRAP